MELINPSYLWALLGLLVPLAIHLLSRKEGMVVKVGSLRHLTETSTRKFSSIRFNEWLLFGLRALSIIFFVLLLAGLTQKSKAVRSKWVLIEPGLEKGTGLDQTLDSLRTAGYEIRYFATDFPLLETEAAITETVNYPFLLRTLQQTPTTALVFAKNRLQAFKGPQQSLPINVTWFQVEPNSGKKLLSATRLQKDTVALLVGTTGPDRTAFTRRFETVLDQQREIGLPEMDLAAINIDSGSAVKVLLVAPDKFQKDATILQAAIAAIAQVSELNIPVEIVTERPDQVADYTCIISFDPAESLKDKKVQLVTFREQPMSKLLVKTGAHSWVLTQRLNREVAVQGNLALALADILLENEGIEEMIAVWDQRSIEEAVFFNGQQSGETQLGDQYIPLDKWLIAFLILFFVVERSIAFYRES